jgi:hypothetical protein
MAYSTWKTRLRVIVQRFAQPTCACMVCMTAPSFVNLISLPHWKIALQTGLGTGILALLLSFTPIGRLFTKPLRQRARDGRAHRGRGLFLAPGPLRDRLREALLTGVVSGLLVLATSFLIEDRARRVRAVWARVRRRELSS